MVISWSTVKSIIGSLIVVSIYYSNDPNGDATHHGSTKLINCGFGNWCYMTINYTTDKLKEDNANINATNGLENRNHELFRERDAYDLFPPMNGLLPILLVKYP